MADWPSWRYGPNGEARVFPRADDVPKGWEDHPSKVARPKPNTASGNEFAAFDHDGDGKPGGSLPKRGRPKKA